MPDASAGERVHALVMATRHDAVAAGIDARVLLDVEVPSPIYRQKRRQILQSFRPRAR